MSSNHLDGNPPNPERVKMFEEASDYNDWMEENGPKIDVIDRKTDTVMGNSGFIYCKIFLFYRKK